MAFVTFKSAAGERGLDAICMCYFSMCYCNAVAVAVVVVVVVVVVVAVVDNDDFSIFKISVRTERKKGKL